MSEVEHTSATEDETEDTCPAGMGDAIVHKDGTACRDGPELVIPYEREFDELDLPTYETSRGLAAKKSRASPALLELVERLAWGFGDIFVEEGIPYGVLGEVVSVCNNSHADWSADCF